MVLIDHQHYQSWSMMVMSKNFYGDQGGLSVRLREPPKKAITATSHTIFAFPPNIKTNIQHCQHCLQCSGQNSCGVLVNC